MGMKRCVEMSHQVEPIVLGTLFLQLVRGQKRWGKRSGRWWPQTAHPAFAKACNEYGIKLKKVPVDPESYQVDLNELVDLISNKTILVVGSCPGFPHGIIDPIEDISDLLAVMDPEGRIGLHVDACLGGFVVPFLRS